MKTFFLNLNLRNKIDSLVSGSIECLDLMYKEKCEIMGIGQ